MTTPEQIDRATLTRVLTAFCGVPTSPVAYSTDPVVISLSQKGVFRFKDGLMSLASSDIDGLTHKADPTDLTSPPIEVPLFQRRCPHAVMDFYHHSSACNRGEINMLSVSVDTFKDYRISLWDPNKSVTPWKIAIQGDQNDIGTWRKVVKPDSKAFTINASAGWRDVSSEAH